LKPRQLADAREDLSYAPFDTVAATEGSKVDACPDGRIDGTVEGFTQLCDDRLTALVGAFEVAVIEPDHSHLCEVEGEWRLIVGDDEGDWQPSTVAYGEFVEDVGVAVGEVGDRGLGLEDVIDHLQSDLSWSRDLVSADRGETEFLGGAGDDELEDAIGSVADIAAVFPDWRDEEALGL